MNNIEKITTFGLSTLLLIVSVLAYTEHGDSMKWHNLFPVVAGVVAGYGLRILVANTKPKR